MDAKTSETMAQDGAQPRPKRTKRREGWRGYALGRDRLELLYRMIYTRPKDGEKLKAEHKARHAKLAGADRAVSINYESLCNDYLNLSNAYGYYKTNFMREANSLRFIAASHLLDEMAVSSELPADYKDIRPVLAASAKATDAGEAYASMLTSLCYALAAHKLTALYSEAFTGSADLVAFPSNEVDAMYSEFVDIQRIISAAPKFFSEVKPMSWDSVKVKADKVREVAKLLAGYDLTVLRPFHCMPLIEMIRGAGV